MEKKVFLNSAVSEDKSIRFLNTKSIKYKKIYLKLTSVSDSLLMYSGSVIAPFIGSS